MNMMFTVRVFAGFQMSVWICVVSARCSVVSVCVSSYMAVCVMHVVKKTDILDESGEYF